jgi:hypothetical protein
MTRYEGQSPAIIKLERVMAVGQECHVRKLTAYTDGVAGVGNVLEGQWATRRHSSAPPLDLSAVRGVKPGLIRCRQLFMMCNHLACQLPLRPNRMIISGL